MLGNIAVTKFLRTVITARLSRPMWGKKRRFFPLFDMTVMLDMEKKKLPSLLSRGMLVALSGNNLTLHVFTYIIFCVTF